MADIRVRYKSKPTVVLTVRLIKTWKPGEIPELVMSTSGGPKEQFKNTIFEIFAHDRSIDAVSLVRAWGPPFLIIRVGTTYYDAQRNELEVMQKAVRRAEA